MLIALAWSILQGPAPVREASLPLPTIASTMDVGPVQN
jgi:hypothetical protein